MLVNIRPGRYNIAKPIKCTTRISENILQNRSLGKSDHNLNGKRDILFKV